jgi:serine protease Do
MNVRSASKSRVSAITFSRILAVSFLAGGLCAGRIDAADSDTANAGDPVSQEVQGVFNHAQNAVVKIEGVDRDHNILVGTGFFVDPNGMIYTSYSVGGDTESIVVSYGDKKYPAERLMQDPRSGIAILKILKVDAHTPFLPVCKSNELPVATPVLVIGYPMNLPLTPSLGVVAGLDSRNDEGYFLTRHIRANVTVQPGQGGSPLLNLKGEVVGIVISGGDSGSSCYALPMEAVEKVRSDYERFGDIHHGVIGIHVVPAAKAAGGSGVVVDDLIENTPAAKSGLQKGDVVLQIGEKKIVLPEDVLNASFFLTAGDEVPVTVLRGDEKITVKVLPVSDTPPTAVEPPGPGGMPLTP